MSHLEKEIKDEKKGEKEYEELAEHHPSESKKLRHIAKDERRHKRELEEMEIEEKKKRVAKKMRK